MMEAFTDEEEEERVSRRNGTYESNKLVDYCSALK
jgi:hypothetical protein